MGRSDDLPEAECRTQCRKDNEVKRYEGLFILNLAGKEEGLNDAVEKLKAEISAAGGKVETIQKMDKKPFVRVTDRRVPGGHYVNFVFTATPKVAAALVEKFHRNLQTALEQQQGRVQAQVRMDRSSDAMELRRPSTLLAEAQAVCSQLELNPEPQAKPTNTEGGVFARMGCEAMVFGPGVSTGNAHCANEFQLQSQCDRAIEFYEALLLRLCTRA